MNVHGRQLEHQRGKQGCVTHVLTSPCTSAGDIDGGESGTIGGVPDVPVAPADLPSRLPLDGILGVRKEESSLSPGNLKNSPPMSDGDDDDECVSDSAAAEGGSSSTASKLDTALC
jgi:hypothetical protein